MKDKVEKYWQWLFILAAFAISLYVRIVRPWKAVFRWTTLLGGNDPWYYYRLILSCIHNFPNRIWFDAFTYYPYGTYTHFGPFLVYTSAIASILMGARTPDQVRTVIAFIPVIGGTLLALPVYLFTKEIFNKRAGAFAALFVVIIPGQLLARSLLGFNDHHVWETFWMVSSFALYAYSINLWGNDDPMENLRSKKIIAPILAGFAFGSYLDTWAPGFVLAVMITLYVFILYIAGDYLKGSKENSAIAGIVMFAVAALMYLPFSFECPGFSTVAYSPFQLFAVLGCIAVLVVFYMIGEFQKTKGLSERTVPAVIVASLIAVVSIISIISPDFLTKLLRVIGVIHPKGGALTVAEVQPFFSMGGQFSFNPAWLNFGVTFFFAIPGFIYTLYELYRSRDNKYVLITVWAVLMFIALCGQNRFAYYFGAVTAIFSAVFLSFAIDVYANYFSERKINRLYLASALWILALIIVRYNPIYYPFSLAIALPAAVDLIFNLGKDFSELNLSELKEALVSKKRQTLALVCIIAIVSSFMFVFVPTFEETYLQSPYAGGINQQWYSALTWMRNNTPYKSFYDKFFYVLYKPGYKPGHPKPYPYPHATYGIMSWWDYGHWITAIAHRMPIANPFQQGIGNKYDNVPGAAPFFTAFNESYADKIAKKLNVKYVVTDVEMATGKFYAMAVWAEGNLVKAYSIYYQGKGYVYELPNGKIGVGSRYSIPQNARIISEMDLPSENYFRTMEARFHIMDGCGLKHYRMIYESASSAGSYMGFQESIYRSLFDRYYASKFGMPKVSVSPTGYVKIFEFVKGATIKGSVPSGVDYVTITTKVTTNQNRTFIYMQKCKVVNGTYQFIVPYAQNTTYPVKPSPYVIKAGNIEKTLSISDQDVEQGKTIVVNLI